MGIAFSNPVPTHEHHHQEAAPAAATGEAVQVEAAAAAAATAREAAREEAVQGAGKEEEEEGECAFCVFMKGGGCKDAFVAWEECVAAAETDGADMFERCFQVTYDLGRCMEAHAEHYSPVFQAAQAASDQAAASAAAAEEKKEVEAKVAPPSST